MSFLTERTIIYVLVSTSHHLAYLFLRLTTTYQFKNLQEISWNLDLYISADH